MYSSTYSLTLLTHLITHLLTYTYSLTYSITNTEGCDIITQHSDTTEPQLVYQAYGGSGIGYNSGERRSYFPITQPSLSRLSAHFLADMREVVGDSVLSAPMLQWGPVYTDFVNKVLTNTWVEGYQAWPGAAEGAVKLMPTFSPRVDPATVQYVEQAREPQL